MRQKLPLFLFVLLLSFPSFGQYNNAANNVWAMSNYCGLNFNSAVIPITTSAHPLVGNNAGEGCASIADGEGDLMFYTDGMTLWNDVGNVMPNGNDIDGIGSAQSMTQSSVIVPFPNDPQLYYLFVLNQQSGNDNVICRIVNRNLDNGHGDIDTANNLDGLKIDSFLTEKMIAVAGCNNDFWLVTRDGSNSVHRYHSFHITASGLNTVSIISTVNYIPGAASPTGVIKINEQRTKIVECNGKLVIRDFNPNTGVVSGGLQIDDMPIAYYGASFSPDGTKVYANIGSTYQFDLNASNITASKTLVGNGSGVTDLKLGPDGKIYLPANTPTTPGRYMARINFPNNAGPACGFQDSVLSLHFQGTSVKSGGAMPNEIWMPFTGGTTNGHLIKDTMICNYSPAIVLHATPGQVGYQWDNGSTDTIRSISQAGNYWVTYTDLFCNHQVDTYKISSALTPTLSIVQTGNVLSTTGTYAAYQWYKDNTLLNGSTNQTLTITGNAVYSVKVSNTAGCSDSVSITVGNGTAINDMNALAQKIIIFPNPANSIIQISSPEKVFISLYNIEGRCLKNPIITTFVDISDLSTGIYLLKVTDTFGRFVKMEKVVKE
jgi:hypothetical protein